MQVAADANVLLSAILGGQAKRILEHPTIAEVLTVPSVMGEIESYLPVLARKKGLACDILFGTFATLPVTILPNTSFRSRSAEARRRIGHRDPDDIDLLAAALLLRIPVWSNDSDFEETGVPWFTTARLLKILDRAGA